ncbi:MAG: hypothetical protein E7182_00265 [Erysipelotrichaceae bacterium]|nr:hypothetical protein [Erysipelotrichaceae bacterium]
MAYASFHESQQQPSKVNDLTSGGLSEGKAIAKIYGYMGIALLVTAVVATGVAWLFSTQINLNLREGSIDTANRWFYVVVGAWIVSLFALLILSFVIPIRASRSGKSLWVPYILYSVFMGIALSAVLLAGIPFWMIGEAFGITALAFGAMFLIGWKSKKGIGVVSFIAMSLLSTILIVAICGLFILMFRGFTADGAFWFDIGITAAMIGVIMLVTIVDTYRIKQIVSRSDQSTNIYLYCSFVMYTDFISILLRVLYIIARLQSRNS